MPFKSTAQQRYMYSQHPGIADRWSQEMKRSKRKGAKEHPIKAAHLPDRVGKSERTRGQAQGAGGALIAGGVASRHAGGKVSRLAENAHTQQKVSGGMMNYHLDEHAKDPLGGLREERLRSVSHWGSRADHFGRKATALGSQAHQLRRAGRTGILGGAALATVGSGRKPVDKARNGGSYEKGPSSMVRGGKLTVARRGRSSKFGNNARCGTRLEVYRGHQDQPRTKLAHFAKGPVWQPTSVALAQRPLTPPNGTSQAPTSTAAGGQVKPGALVPTNGAPQANVSGRAAGGQKSGSIKASGKLKPSVAQGSVGTIAAQQPVKKDGGTLLVRTHGPTHRHYDPESRRQRRLGQAQASTGIAGGGLIAAGVKSTKGFNERHKVVPLTTHANAAAAAHVRGSLALRGKPAAAVAGGAALLAGSNKIRRYANDPRNREWS